MRAKLALVEAVSKLSSPQQLQVRIGAATGLVVVGDLIGSGAAAQEQAIVGKGQTSPRACKPQRRPAPWLSIRPLGRLLAGLFEYRDLGSIE